jgi:transcriptional regulator with XRE-family HTH domain
MQGDALYLEFGRLVREHRRRLKLTQEELGELVGLTRTSITNIERGRQKVLLHQVFQIASSLKVNPEALLPVADLKEISPVIDEKLGKHLTGAEKEWARRIVVSSSKGGVPGATSKDQDARPPTPRRASG